MAGVTETEVSVVTLAELTLGVLMADDAERAAGVAALSAVESTWDLLPVDAAAGVGLPEEALLEAARVIP
jgi:hypothetical protein